MQSFRVTKVQPSLGRKGWQGKPWEGLDGKAEAGGVKGGALASFLREEKDRVRPLEFFGNKGTPPGHDFSHPHNRVPSMRRAVPRSQ